MDKIKKLLKKISWKDREKLLEGIKLLKLDKGAALDISKIKGSSFFRLRIGKYRIIFHYQDDRIKIDSIKLRDKDTYKGL